MPLPFALFAGADETYLCACMPCLNPLSAAALLAVGLPMRQLLTCVAGAAARGGDAADLCADDAGCGLSPGAAGRLRRALLAVPPNSQRLLAAHVQVDGCLAQRIPTGRSFTSHSLQVASAAAFNCM